MEFDFMINGDVLLECKSLNEELKKYLNIIIEKAIIKDNIITLYCNYYSEDEKFNYYFKKVFNNGFKIDIMLDSFNNLTCKDISKLIKVKVKHSLESSIDNILTKGRR